MQKGYIITGIDTNAGKTVVSSIIAQKLGASYWKPVQSGDLENSDSQMVDQLTTGVKILKERFRLTQPMSPHAAAERDGVKMQLSDFDLPEAEDPLVIEGAGGVMVPINDEGLTYLDLFKFWNLPVILVSRHYLGSINHTLMSIEILKRAGLEIAGLVFVGDENPDTESVILQNSGVRCLGRIPFTEKLNKEFIREQAERIDL